MKLQQFKNLLKQNGWAVKNASPKDMEYEIFIYISYKDLLVDFPLGDEDPDEEFVRELGNLTAEQYALDIVQYDCNACSLRVSYLRKPLRDLLVDGEEVAEAIQKIVKEVK